MNDTFTASVSWRGWRVMRQGRVVAMDGLGRDAALKIAQILNEWNGAVVQREYAHNSGNSKRVRCVDTGDEFASMDEAACWLRARGYPKARNGGICQCCKGRTPKAYGYKWEYVEDRA